jgi:hypothetical protein
VIQRFAARELTKQSKSFRYWAGQMSRVGFAPAAGSRWPPGSASRAPQASKLTPVLLRQVPRNADPSSRSDLRPYPGTVPRREDVRDMQLDPLTLVLAGGSIVVIAVLIAVIAGTLAARLFFHASGVAREDRSARGQEPQG